MLIYFVNVSFYFNQAIAWGFGAAIIITVLPLTESSEDINMVLSGVFNAIFHREAHRAIDPNAKEKDEVLADSEELVKEDVAPRANAESDSEFEA